MGVFASFINAIEQSVVQSIGSYAVLALILVLVFLGAYLVMGVDFRFSLLLISPLIPSFASGGWIPAWVEGLFWIVGVGFGMYFLYVIIKDRS